MTLAPSRPALRVRAQLKFPARVVQGAGMLITRLNGIFTFSLNYPDLVDTTSIADPSTYTIATLNRTTGQYEETRLDRLPLPAETATRTPRGGGTYSILNTDRYVALTAALTAPRTWTLPAASTVPGGRLLVIQDEVGGLSGTNPITLIPSGTDTINGAGSFVLATARGGVELRSDGAGRWSARSPADASVTNAKLALAPAGTLKGNLTGAVATPTDVSTTALLVALGIYVPPQGRLTLTSGTPVMTTSVSAAATVFYTPDSGALVPIWNGTAFVPTVFSEVSQALSDTTESPAAAVAGAVYDVFAWSDGGTVRATRGPPWSAGTGGSNTARGTGAGSTALTRVNGVPVNAVAITNGPAVGFGTYLGTFATDAGGATVTYKFGASAAGGSAAVFNLWNMYNRRPVSTMVMDSTGTWNVNTTRKAANNSTSNRITFVRGLDEDTVGARYRCAGYTDAAQYTTINTYLGLDSVTGGAIGSNGILQTEVAASSPIVDIRAEYVGLPGLGAHFIQAQEATAQGTGVFVGNGAQALSADLRM